MLLPFEHQDLEIDEKPIMQILAILTGGQVLVLMQV